MRTSWRSAIGATALLALLPLAACGSTTTSAGDSGGPSITDPPATTAPGTTAPGTTLPTPSVTFDPHQVYDVDATVLEDGKHAPQACNMVLTSYPPQCGGLPLAHFSWSDAPTSSVTRVGGITWAGLHLVGTWDGTTLSLTEKPIATPATTRPAPPVDFTAPCPEPAGGWVNVDPTRISNADHEALIAAARREPDFVQISVDESHRTPPVKGQPSSGVLVVAFTGDLARHRAELAAIWGGPLCVVRGSATTHEVDAALARLRAPDPANRVGLLTSGIGGNRGDVAVEISVIVDNPSVRAWVHARMGDVPYQLDGWLKPVTNRGVD